MCRKHLAVVATSMPVPSGLVEQVFDVVQVVAANQDAWVLCPRRYSPSLSPGCRSSRCSPCRAAPLPVPHFASLQHQVQQFILLGIGIGDGGEPKTHKVINRSVSCQVGRRARNRPNAQTITW